MNEQERRRRTLGPVTSGRRPGREELLRTILILAAGAAFLAMAVFVVLGIVYPAFPVALIVASGAFGTTAVISLLLSNRRSHGWAVGVYMVGLTMVTFMAVYFAGGVRGPITIVLLSIPVVAGLLGGRRAAGQMVFLVVGVYLVLAILEGFGLIQPGEIGGVAQRIVYHAVFVLVIAMVTYLVMASAQLTEDALTAEEERGRQLAEANLQLEQAVGSEAEARRREEAGAWQLRRAVARYSEYLSQVAAGNYAVRLELDRERVSPGGDGQVGGPAEELVILGRQIEDTVRALVEALSSLQDVQRRYVQQSWAEFARTGFQREYRYQPDPGRAGEGVAEVDEDWLASMAETVRGRHVTADEGELALPITLRGELLGAIGLRRDEGGDWSEADLALAETISDQLAQTMESLRLLDQTQRRAASDRVLAGVTSRMRETLNVEALLKTAVDEIAQALGLAALELRLGMPAGDEGTAPGEAAAPEQESLDEAQGTLGEAQGILGEAQGILGEAQGTLGEAQGSRDEAQGHVGEGGTENGAG